MRGSRFYQPLSTIPLFPNNGVPARPGEDRPGLSPFGRLAMGANLGTRSILIYDGDSRDVQSAATDMIGLEGDDLDSQQLILTLHPPRVIPLCFGEVSQRLDQQNLTGEQSNGEISPSDFPGTHDSMQWPPLEAAIEFGTGGVNTKVVVDYLNGVTLALEASFLRVQALVTQTREINHIFGTSAAYYLAAHVGPGFAESHARRTIYVERLGNCEESEPFDVPRFGKTATLVGFHRHHKKVPQITTGWIRFWQSPDRTNGVGDFFFAQSQPVAVPNGAQYFTVLNTSGSPLRTSVVFELAL